MTMTDPKKPRNQRKSKAPLEIQDLSLNKETVADLTEGEAEGVQGGRIKRETSIAISCAEQGCE
jgi:hypothetical protein